jgi:hypothetical protein
MTTNIVGRVLAGFAGVAAQTEASESTIRALSKSQREQTQLRSVGKVLLTKSEDLPSIIQCETADAVRHAAEQLHSLVINEFSDAINPDILFVDATHTANLFVYRLINESSEFYAQFSKLAETANIMFTGIVDITTVAKHALSRVNPSNPIAVSEELADILNECDYRSVLSELRPALDRFDELSRCNRPYRRIGALQGYLYRLDTESSNTAVPTKVPRSVRSELKRIPGPDAILTLTQLERLAGLLGDIAKTSVETNSCDLSEAIVEYLQALNEAIATIGYLLLIFGLVRTRVLQIQSLKGD